MSVLDSLVRALFPSSCLGCGRDGTVLCTACWSPKRPLTRELGDLRVDALGGYDGLLRRAILAFKRGRRAYAHVFAEHLRAMFGVPPLVVPVPTTRARAGERGFDQAELVARSWTPYVADGLRHVGDAAQHGRNRVQRLEARTRFRRTRVHIDAPVIVFDDVCTTGATLRDACATLRASGVTVSGAVVLALAEQRNRRNRFRVLGSMKATWNGAVLAQSENTVVVEGNHYFPPDAVNREYFKESSTHTICPWKGTASYYTVDVNGKQNPDAAWFYPTPKDAAKQIRDHVAFWKGVEVTP